MWWCMNNTNFMLDFAVKKKKKLKLFESEDGPYS